jgi:oligopeptide/dipeptide ABC transporter ATP-binding protein
MTTPLPPHRRDSGRPLLDVRDLRVFYGKHGLQAVHDVSFRLETGRRYGMVGETGCGKSTVLKAVLGLVRAPHRVQADTMELTGAGDLLHLRPRALRALRGAEIGYVAQNPFGALHPVLTVGEQFHRFLAAHGATRSRKDSRERAVPMLDRLGVPDAARVHDGHAGALSGGMAQRVVIAFASILEPRLVIADEPTTALDVTVQRQVLDLMATPDPRRTLLMTTHDLSVVAQYCDEVFVMYAGRVVESGPVDSVFVDPQHPYTAALLGSVPRPGQPLASLPGSPPSLGEHTTGCDFAPRCRFRTDVCAQQPPLEHVGGVADHAVACHHPLGGAA